ncbi:60S acidic ribosomal protein P2 [Symbiodinium microadriaticum]|uniref:60S acidic ribosomal protein P2 n=1 Tax=Symbiodinium microadriaticum TaxID=2951 RepID=A0A1Q9BWW4_SYMMI|nr:60S acidic ribosomal protein P2 [Symbiodinium microadriaticum]
MGMKYVAAYLMAATASALAGKDSPSADDIKSILESVESEYDESIASKLVSEPFGSSSRLEGKTVHEVVAEGKEKLKAQPAGFGGGGGGGPAIGGGGGAAAPAAEAKKVEEEEEEEETALRRVDVCHEVVAEGVCVVGVWARPVKACRGECRGVVGEGAGEGLGNDVEWQASSVDEKGCQE